MTVVSTTAISRHAAPTSVIKRRCTKTWLFRFSGPRYRLYVWILAPFFTLNAPRLSRCAWSLFPGYATAAIDARGSDWLTTISDTVTTRYLATRRRLLMPCHRAAQSLAATRHAAPQPPQRQTTKRNIIITRRNRATVPNNNDTVF